MSKCMAVGLSFAVVLAGASGARTQGARELPLTPDELLSVSPLATAASWTPDGTRVLFTSALDGGLWTLPATGGAPQRLTPGGAQARYSPTGAWVAYVSEKSGAPELYAWSPATGRELQLTRLGSRVGSFAWSPDGGRIAFSGDRYGSQDIYVVTVPGATVTRLTSDVRYEVYPSWTPDGRSIVYQRMADSWVDRDWMAVSAAGGTPHLIIGDTGFMDYGGGRDVGLGRVSPDGRTLLFKSQRGGYRAYWVVALAGGSPRRIDDDSLDETDASWSPDGAAILFITQDNGTHTLRLAPAAGGKARGLVAPQSGVVSQPEWSPDGKRVLYALATPTTPADLYVINVADGKPTRLTFSDPGGHVEDALVVPEKVTYPSADGFTIHAYLYRPLHLRAGEKAPGIMYLHGGPTGHFADSFNSQAEFFAQHGYAVLAPNIRGSSGYGKKFEDANNGCWGHCDLKDVVAGVAYLKTLPYVDADKMGITGISYGGIMTMAAVAFAPGVFQAAVAQSGYADWVHFFDYNNVLQHVKLLAYEFGPFPDSIASCRRASPIYSVDQVTTPIFILHGVGAKVPYRPGQLEVPAGLDFARALDQHYKIFRYKTYPGETYYVYGKANSKQVMLDMLDFFEQFLRGAATAPPAEVAAQAGQTSR